VGPTSYDTWSIAGEREKKVEVLPTRQELMAEEADMRRENEVASLLREIRDLIQVLVLRDQTLLDSLSTAESPERHSHSWFFSAHKTHTQKPDDSAEAPGDLAQ
jgi:hypothetical protein